MEDSERLLQVKYERALRKLKRKDMIRNPTPTEAMEKVEQIAQYVLSIWNGWCRSDHPMISKISRLREMVKLQAGQSESDADYIKELEKECDWAMLMLSEILVNLGSSLPEMRDETAFRDVIRKIRTLEPQNEWYERCGVARSDLAVIRQETEAVVNSLRKENARQADRIRELEERLAKIG